MIEIQDLDQEDISMSWPTLYSTTIGKNSTNGKMSPNWLDYSRNKNNRAYATNTTNKISKAKWKSARTRWPGPRPIIVRLIVEEKETR